MSDAVPPPAHVETPALTITRKAHAPVLQPPETGWPYLESPAFRLRGAIAAHLVRDCRDVVEIGGGRTPLDGYLEDREVHVTVLDPFLPDADRPMRHGGRARHLRARFQDVEWTIREPGSYALVMLGLELLDMSEQDFANLYALIDAAALTVLEFSSTFDTPQQQYAMIRANCRANETLHVTYDLTHNDFGPRHQSWPVHPHREFHVLAD